MPIPDKDFGMRYDFIRLKIAKKIEPGLCENPAKILQGGALCRSPDKAIPDGSSKNCRD